MYILHIALGGCLTFPAVRYGVTEDTGGHIAYILGAVTAQAKRTDVDRVDIVTRAFDDPDLGSDHMHLVQTIGPKSRILRLATSDRRYLAKEALAAERPALERAFADLIGRMGRKPDVIHAHFSDAVMTVRRAAARHDIPVVYTPHSLGIDKQACLKGPGCAVLARRIDEEREALATARAIVVSSRDEAERQVEAYDADVAAAVHRVAPGVNLPAAPSGTVAASALVDPYLTDPERPMILAVARPVIRKNLLGLLRAYAEHPTLRDRANLVILAGQRGGGIVQNEESRRVTDALLREAARPDLAGRVALPPRHAPKAVPQLYRLAAARGGVFVNPALHEPFGLTLLEAARFGLPVVATREGGPADILETIGHGTLVDPTDASAIGAAIDALISDRTEWQRAASAARRNMQAFDWNRWADRVQRVYSEFQRPRRSFAQPRHLLASDIDGTLTGSAASARRFGSWVAKNRHIPFAVATGRSIVEARNVLHAWSLPEPDIFITAVGTELHVREADGRFHLCHDYASRLHEDWDRDAAWRVLTSSSLELQPSIEQRRWKLACYGSQREAELLRERYRRSGVAVRIVASHGNLIDILAPNGGKAAAVAAAARRFGLNLTDCITAGDSGNDSDMLVASGLGILVANARPEMATLHGGRIYRAEASHAAGILEGLAHLGLVREEPKRRSQGVPA
ncbi:HAD-IIB family hydrolase [uncultured Jannaschia sp.]|uniref:HAD-IIB family hydrolase n=1 Tax=uncultured Jannaschia sp. TaxID=293347 RepID=UPI002639DC83|nr:HAD-IIB family hydrolase [uncultured Jannaschia sp.]